MKQLIVLTCWVIVVLAGSSAAENASDDVLEVVVRSYDVPGEQAYLDMLARDFTQQTGHKVRITLEVWDHAHKQIADWVANGTGPDLTIVPDIWLAEFADNIEPYGTYVDADAIRDEYFTVLFDKGIYRDQLMGLVWATSTKALFYRTDLFARAGLQPPRTVGEMIAAAVVLNDPPNIYGLGLPGKREYETDDNFYFYFWTMGGKFFDEQGKSAINSPAGVRALQLYVDFVNKYHVTQPEVTSWSRKQTRRLFESGRLAMFATGPWGVESLRKNAPSLHFDVIPFPVDREPITQIITDHIVILDHSDHKQQAAEFIRFAYQDTYRLAYAKLGLIPEKRAVAADGYFKKDPQWRVFIDVIPYGRTIPLIQWEQIGIATRQTMYDCLSGRKKVREGLNELADTIDELVAATSTSTADTK